MANEALVASLAPIGERVTPGSCLVVGVDGAPVYDDGGPTSVMPASNMKLVTAAVALEVLGPDHRFTTEAKADQAPADGTIAGNLYLVGGGDPVLGTNPYVAAAAAQVRRIRSRTSRRWRRWPTRSWPPGSTASPGRWSVTTAATTPSASSRRGRPATPTSREAGPLGALLVNDAAETLQPLRSAADPAVHGASVLTQLLRARGVTVAGDRRGAWRRPARPRCRRSRAGPCPS